MKPQIQCFQHVSYESPGAIRDWAGARDIPFHIRKLYEGDPLPDSGETDFLILMGGPMNVYDYHIHPWLQEEQTWVRDYLETGKPCLGICLGAQILAAALGAEVRPGPHREIGWHTLNFLPSLGDFRIWSTLPSARNVFHWHGDTFDIPDGAIRIAESRAYPNQGFLFDRRVLALQFHLEVSPGMVADMVAHGQDELREGPHVQSAGEILAAQGHYSQNQESLYAILDYLWAQL
ncbi:MAG: type 1 glutamine amidotransferase [Bacteroidales bacterium]